MSGHYDPTAHVPLPEIMDQGYPMYDNHYNPYSRLAGPPSHYDGVAFWYRPDNTDTIYEPDPSLYNRGVALPGANMETTGIKHRRTRSGCYTCRSRRVKCDEARPICERCKKGGRECEFPQASSSSKRVKSGEPRSPQEANKQELKDTKSSKLDTIKDEIEDEEDVAKPSRRPTVSGARTQSSQSISKKHRHRQSQSISPTVKEKASPQSSTSSSSQSRGETPASSFHASARSAEIQARHAKIKALRPDVQKYLQFQHDHMTHYHYFFKLDPTDFIHNEFIDQALSFEPLLYAVVGFAAYHYELRQPHANISHFLNYHSRALVLLRKSLSKGEQTTYTPAMLLTVLQLATVEEYLGDWVNLVGHHKAGYTMLTTLYTPEPMMSTDLGRRIFSWYARLDVIAGLMGGSSTRLDRPWFEANATWYASAVDDDLDNDIDIDGNLANFVATNRILGFDMATLFAKLPRQEISMAEFKAENAKIVARLQEMKASIEGLNDSFYTVTSFPAATTHPLNPAVDIVDPYIPGGLFKDALWNLNFMWIDWYAIQQMQTYQASLLLHQDSPRAAELNAISLQQCRIYEAIERYPDAPEGSILGAHASLGLAIVFLTKDAKHTMWARRKLASIERLGYVFPEKFRSQMAQLWGLSTEQVGDEESVEDWWLPNGEGRLPILSEIRKVVRDRHASGDEMIMTSNLQDVRDLKAIFAKLDLRTQQGGGKAEDTNASPQSESVKSAESTTGVNSPSSATSTGAGGTVDTGGTGQERWGGSGNGTGTGSQASAKGKERAREVDRMSGIWST